MSTTHRIKTWVDTGTGRQAEGEIEVEVAGGVIVGDTAAGGSALQVYSSGAIAINELVYVSGRNETLGFPSVTLADANVSGKQAQFVARTAIAAGATGMVFTASRTAADLNTNAVTSVGDPVYLSETVGGWTETAPTAATSTAQIVGHCAVKSATIGVIEFDLRDFPTVTTNDLQDLAVTVGKLAGSITEAKITALTLTDASISASAAIARTKLAEDALAVHGIPATALKSAAGAALLAAETAGTFNIAVAANVVSVQAEITDNETEVSVGYFQFVLPCEYVAAGDVTVRIKTALIKTAAAVNNGSTLDVEVFEQTGNGAVGADICATAAQSWAADDTWYTKDFVITATSLVAGDILNVKVTTSVVDSEAGAGSLRANLDGIAMLLDVKG